MNTDDIDFNIAIVFYSISVPEGSDLGRLVNVYSMIAVLMHSEHLDNTHKTMFTDPSIQTGLKKLEHLIKEHLISRNNDDDKATL